MAAFRIGTAPVSWGFGGPPDWAEEPPWERVLREMSEAGYTGTETGPWGFLPKDPERLHPVLAECGLELVGAYSPFDLHSPEINPADLEELAFVADRLATFGAKHLIIGESGSEHRGAIAGRVEAEAGADRLDREGWLRARARLELILAQVKPKGLEVSIHPHVGTYIETEREIDELVQVCGDLPIWLCLDTGHLAYAGADPVAVFERFADRVRICHLKDVDLVRLQECMAQGMSQGATVRAGVYVPLGKGGVDFGRIRRALERAGFDGWLIVEQDRPPENPGDPLTDARTSRRFLSGWGE